jgi:vacuolar-type H+-ATPase subunit H
MLILVSAIRENLPAEIKQAAWMLDQNRQLIAEARKEAEAIRRDAEAKMTSMIDEHEITERARKMAAETVETANGSARQIRAGAMDYAKKKLSELEEQLTEILVTIQRHKKELK